MRSAGPHGSLSGRNRAGIALMVLLGLANLASALIPTPSGNQGPPTAVLLIGTIGGIVVLAAALSAWRSGYRRAIRLAAGVLILLALSSLPAFFDDVPAGIKVPVAVSVVLTFAAAVLSLSPGRRPATVVA